jgi:hypothetical protein
LEGDVRLETDAVPLLRHASGVPDRALALGEAPKRRSSCSRPASVSEAEIALAHLTAGSECPRTGALLERDRGISAAKAIATHAAADAGGLGAQIWQPT